MVDCSQLCAECRAAEATLLTDRACQCRQERDQGDGETPKKQATPDPGDKEIPPFEATAWAAVGGRGRKQRRGERRCKSPLINSIPPMKCNHSDDLQSL